MKENIDLNAGKKIKLDRRSVGFQEPDIVEVVVNDIQDFNLPPVVEKIAIKFAVKVGRYFDKEKP